MCALEAEEGFAKTSDGLRIFHRVSGKGPFALVMPVNWGMDSYVYAKGFSSMEFWLALVTFDPRGVGRSDPARSPEEFGLDTTAADAAAVASALGLHRGVVVGHSSGGAVALTYALRYPDRVSHLILVSTAPRWTAPSPLREGVLPRSEGEMREQVRTAIAHSVRRPERFAHVMDELLPRMRFSPERLRWSAENESRSYDVRGRLQEIHAPTLIVHGRDDQAVPPTMAEELHAGIEGSELVLFEDCGHWPFVERRADFVAAVKDFLGLEDVHLRR